jgi:hypothetical protein
MDRGWEGLRSGLDISVFIRYNNGQIPKPVPVFMPPAIHLKRLDQPKNNQLTDTSIRVCPECAGPIARISGCITCIQCGWGKCG